VLGSPPTHRVLRGCAGLAPVAALTLVMVVGDPHGAAAWGFEAHRYIATRAIDLLPPQLKPFFKKHQASITEHAIDPDLWRNAGWEEEPPRHFLDLDAYGPPPFDALPRDYDQAVAKFGYEKVQKEGLLPWRTAEMFAKLKQAFTDHKNGRGFAPENIKFFTAVVAHYVADAHVPFHAVVNYDGQLTGQHGIHSRFESELFERYRKKLTVVPRPTTIAMDPRDFIFDTLIVSAGLVDPILAADKAAIGTGDLYDDAYFDRFFEPTRPLLERRLSEATAAVAALVTRAWEEAGRPELPTKPVKRPPRKRTAPSPQPAPTPGPQGN
jgi:hypothetical protein